MPIAMIAPMNDWTFKVVPVSRSMSKHAAEDRRNGQQDRQRQAQRLEVRGQQQEDRQHRQQQADAQSGEGLLERRNLAAQAHAQRPGAARRRRRWRAGAAAPTCPSVMP